MSRVTAVAGSALAIMASVLIAPAAPVTPGGGGVSPADLPTTRQVARIYPFLEGGSREVRSSRRMDVRGPDCLGYVTGARAANGRYADYLLSDGSYPFFSGYTDPAVFVYQFDTARSAGDAFAAARSSIRRCEGTVADPDGYRVTSRELAVPDLADARIAHRETVQQPGGGDRQYFITMYMRHGRYLAEVRVQRDPGPSPKRPFIRLARLTLRTLS